MLSIFHYYVGPPACVTRASFIPHLKQGEITSDLHVYSLIYVLEVESVGTIILS